MSRECKTARNSIVTKHCDHIVTKIRLEIVKIHQNWYKIKRGYCFKYPL